MRNRTGSPRTLFGGCVDPRLTEEGHTVLRDKIVAEDGCLPYETRIAATPLSLARKSTRVVTLMQLRAPLLVVERVIISTHDGGTKAGCAGMDVAFQTVLGGSALSGKLEGELHLLCLVVSGQVLRDEAARLGRPDLPVEAWFDRHDLGLELINLELIKPDELGLAKAAMDELSREDPIEVEQMRQYHNC